MIPLKIPTKERVQARIINLTCGESVISIELITIKNTTMLFNNINKVEYFSLLVMVKIFQSDSNGNVNGKANVPSTVSN